MCGHGLARLCARLLRSQRRPADSACESQAAVLVATAAIAQPLPDRFTPARRAAGSAPALPSPLTPGWITETVEVVVDEAGRPQTINPVQSAPGVSLLEPAVRDWRFRPAVARRQVVPPRVLVVGIFRPPMSLMGPVLGSPPKTAGVVVELLVSRTGEVESASQSPPTSTSSLASDAPSCSTGLQPDPS